MTSMKAQSEICRLMDFLQEWDHADRTFRCRMLNDFINANQGKTGPELEIEFAQGASLFLTRVTAWLRLSYMIGTCLSEQLKAIGVFLSAASSQRYIIEVLEVGGLLTFLDILGLKQAREEDKQEAIKLLQIIASGGRKYKELICESYGVRAIAECLAKSKLEKTQEQAQILLELLAQAIELIKKLLEYEIRSDLLKRLAGLLNLCKDPRNRPKILEDQSAPNLLESAPMFIQQAAAAKVIGILIQNSVDISEELMQHELVRKLLITMGNRNHFDSQRQASLALHYIVCTNPNVAEQVKTSMGIELFEMFMNDPENLYQKITEVHADALFNNKANLLLKTEDSEVSPEAEQDGTSAKD
ncbi:armadillo-like helical domain containing protein 1 isoform X2 [Callorhinchus milii]|uniref:armadillo-like helical domain containing protein 1 isoform X2 n=1 Tax=Callorhinchus milii TaxID=7868 RepID=UPI0004574334|nr:armadillo-like helical domain containing protein 1 isoform X2 [Callorhinchus milii]|eukprot:gi/632963732/ref/XP_007898049.1/ PREDICTED: uncharacterized protein C1orf228 homolog isoform X3 [Callorhinchus milii]